MLNSIIQPDFLLSNNFARRLYHDHVKDLPIIDYHNHLPPNEINGNRSFENISQVWLAGDHYKWRAMRTLGIDEDYITGSASDSEKFDKWAETVPYTLRNPLYHWTHLELHRYFGIEDLLSEKNTSEIYKKCNDLLSEERFSVQGLLSQRQVETVCTTDDPIDSLIDHREFKMQGKSLNMLPAFRPDKAYQVSDPKAYLEYLGRLEEASGIAINSYEDLLSALENRIDFFHENGCRLSDHGLERIGSYELGAYDPAKLFSKVRSGHSLSEDEFSYFTYHTLIELGKMYHSKGWVMQFHLGALRNTNSRAFRNLGPDTGFDSIGDFDQSKGLASLLNQLDSENQLSRTVLYNLNPRDNEVFATMAGNFNDGTIKGKIQFGSGWWYLDQMDGMEKQMNTLSNMGLLSCFVGMLTDSRSFLSFPRHEYFRRILCNLFGQDIENGLIPNDEKWIATILKDICYFNAKNYFDLDSKNIISNG